MRLLKGGGAHSHSESSLSRKRLCVCVCMCVSVCVCVTERERAGNLKEFKGRRRAFIGIHSVPVSQLGLERSARRSLGGEQEGDSNSLSEQGLRSLAFAPL